MIAPLLNFFIVVENCGLFSTKKVYSSQRFRYIESDLDSYIVMSLRLLWIEGHFFNMTNKAPQIWDCRLGIVIDRNVAYPNPERYKMKISWRRTLYSSFNRETPIIKGLNAFVKDLLNIMFMHEHKLKPFFS